MTLRPLVATFRGTKVVPAGGDSELIAVAPFLNHERFQIGSHQIRILSAKSFEPIPVPLIGIRGSILLRPLQKVLDNLHKAN